jgi:alkylation response protein AidB-like acyl-CoA dehydrogenase
MNLSFAAMAPTPELTSLRLRVRAFLDAELKDLSAETRTASWDGFDAEFSRKVGSQGWIGMTWPKEYGGSERTFLERFVVIEEMLAAGAPVAAHWFADRQSGPLILRYGTEAQRRDLLPRVARGELFFAVGMSEPNAGSDVAAVRSRARQVGGGWLLNGAKLWSTNAHRAHYMIALVRTSGEAEDRHAGLSQVLIDLSAPGVRIKPIPDMARREHFNEVVFEEVLLPESAVIGNEGEGWKQVMAELAFERSGPERYLSSLQELLHLVSDPETIRHERAQIAVGKAVAHLTVLRQMSLSVSAQLQAGKSPDLEAAIVKDLGTTFEQSLPEVIHDILGTQPTLERGPESERVHARLLELAPCFSLRGGTREVLRGIIARGLGLR